MAVFLFSFVVFLNRYTGGKSEQILGRYLTNKDATKVRNAKYSVSCGLAPHVWCLKFKGLLLWVALAFLLVHGRLMYSNQDNVAPRWAQQSSFMAVHACCDTKCMYRVTFSIDLWCTNWRSYALSPPLWAWEWSHSLSCSSSSSYLFEKSSRLVQIPVKFLRN